MSAHIEYALISKVLETQDFHTLEKLQISADFFTAPEMRVIYEFLRNTYHNPATSGLVPTAEMVRQYYPGFTPSYAPDALPVLCQALRHSKMRMELLGIAQKVGMEAEKDPAAALSSLKLAAQTLSAMNEVGVDLSMSGAYQTLMDRYNTVSVAGGVVGIPYPWEILNGETQGMQNGTFIVLYGRPKSMKSWLGIHIAAHAYEKSRRRVLYYTREMPPLQIAQRVAATLCGVPYREFKNGSLPPATLAQAQFILQGLCIDEQSAGKHGHQPAFIITSDRSHGGGGVSWLAAKIRETQPDLVIVDGMYLMRDDRTSSRNVDWKNVVHISQDLKQTAMELDIPIVGITQANRKSDGMKGSSMDDMAYTDAFTQDADAIFRVKKTVKRDEHTGQKITELIVWTPGLREGQLDGFVVGAQPGIDFQFLRTVVDEDEMEEPKYEGKQKPTMPTAAFRKNSNNYMKTDPVIPTLK